MAVDFLGRFDDQAARVFVSNACDISASAAHAIAVFPNACRDSFHRLRGSCFHAADPTEKCRRTTGRSGGLVLWDSAGAAAGNLDSAPGLLAPDSEDLHLAPAARAPTPGPRAAPPRMTSTAMTAVRSSTSGQL